MPFRRAGGREHRPLGDCPLGPWKRLAAGGEKTDRGDGEQVSGAKEATTEAALWQRKQQVTHDPISSKRQRLHNPIHRPPRGKTCGLLTPRKNYFL